jgi:hypothetical protein
MGSLVKVKALSPQEGETQTMHGWLIYGAALNEGRELFDKTNGTGFHNWLTSAKLAAVHDHDRAAAMWAAGNPEEYRALRVLKTRGLTWERWLLDHCPISRRRADEVIAISDGRKTLEETRDRVNTASKASHERTRADAKAYREQQNACCSTPDRPEKPNENNEKALDFTPSQPIDIKENKLGTSIVQNTQGITLSVTPKVAPQVHPQLTTSVSPVLLARSMSTSKHPTKTPYLHDDQGKSHLGPYIERNTKVITLSIPQITPSIPRVSNHSIQIGHEAVPDRSIRYTA